MALNREAIYGALWSRLEACDGFVTRERRLRHVNDVPREQQPYLCMTQGDQFPSYDVGRTTQWKLNAIIYLYSRAPDGEAPGPIMNPLLDAVTGIFKFDNTMGNSFTLGGLVNWCRMVQVDTDEGTLGEQSIVRISVEIDVYDSQP